MEGQIDLGKPPKPGLPSYSPFLTYRFPRETSVPPHYLGRAFLPVGNGVKKTLVTEVIARFITGSGAHLVRTGRNLV